MKSNIRIIILLIVAISSCQKREWNNPFDPECPKEIWTPINFEAKQQVNAINFTWVQSENNISGFRIERKIEGETAWKEVVSPEKASNSWADQSITGGKLYEYRIVALAGGNESNFTTVQIKPIQGVDPPLTGDGTVSDIDGNVYNTVTIGTQIWMAENLKTTKFSNGNPLPNVTDASEWVGLKTGAYCNYNNDISNADTYGRLYNWYSISDTRNLAPTGWHMPTEAEWTTLITNLGGELIAGGKLKETGTVHWLNPNSQATNESGFKALPGGVRGVDGKYNIIGSFGFWWSSTEYGTSSVFIRSLSYNKGEVYNGAYTGKLSGFSVRCIKD